MESATLRAEDPRLIGELASIETLKLRRAAVESILLVADWHRLATSVEAFAPDVVVLVARKMPRVGEALSEAVFRGGNSRHTPIVISDLAIPYCSQLIRGARIAVIDDVVNVGTTLDNARKRLLDCGALEVALFALTGRKSALDMHSIFSILPPVEEAGLADFAWRIPKALKLLSKPYDLDFPVLRCKPSPLFQKPSMIFDYLVAKFGRQSVYCLESQSSENFGLYRFTVNLAGESGNYKIRFYIDDILKTCNVVPIAIPGTFVSDWNVFRGTIVEAFTRHLLGVQDDNFNAEVSETNARAWLYSYSLLSGLSSMGLFEDILTVDAEEPIDISAANLIFGPEISRYLSNIEIESPLNISLPTLPKPAKVRSTPFCEHQLDTVLLDFARSHNKSENPFEIFCSIFEALGKLVGASSPSEYSLSWPYSKEQIQTDPYLRLRVGLTFDDLVSIYGTLAHRTDKAAIRNLVSLLLDLNIDCGAVVPTFSVFENCTYRVYRKGESDSAHDKFALRVKYAREKSGSPSATRTSKIVAIIGYSQVVKSNITLKSDRRGTTAAFQPGVLDFEQTELTRYMKEIGIFEEVD